MTEDSVRGHLQIAVEPFCNFVPVRGNICQRFFSRRHLVSPELGQPDIERRPVSFGVQGCAGREAAADC